MMFTLYYVVKYTLGCAIDVKSLMFQGFCSFFKYGSYNVCAHSFAKGCSKLKFQT